MKKEQKSDQILPVNPLLYPEVIRLRPGMFVGSVDSRGFLNLLKGTLYDVINYYHTTSISIEIKGTQSLCLRFKTPVESITNYWAAYKSDSFNSPFSVGLETLNALSTNFSIKLIDDSSNIILHERFEKGKALKESPSNQFLTCAEMEVECSLDASIWGSSFVLNPIFILDEIKHFAYLNRNVQFEVKYSDDNRPCRIIYHFKHGLQDQLRFEQRNGLGRNIFETHINASLEGFKIEIAFAFREYGVDESILKSYVNNYYTHENGTHVDALLKGLTYGVMQYFQKQEVTHYRISEKGIRESLVAFLHIQLDEPRFVGCVRNKLANPEILEPISNLVAEVLFQKMELEAEVTQQLIRKFEI